MYHRTKTVVGKGGKSGKTAIDVGSTTIVMVAAFIFMACTLPRAVGDLLKRSGVLIYNPRMGMTVMGLAQETLETINCSANGIFYFIFSIRFRQEAKRLVCGKICVRFTKSVKNEK